MPDNLSTYRSLRNQYHTIYSSNTGTWHYINHNYGDFLVRMKNIPVVAEEHLEVFSSLPSAQSTLPLQNLYFMMHDLPSSHKSSVLTHLIAAKWCIRDHSVKTCGVIIILGFTFMWRITTTELPHK